MAEDRIHISGVQIGGGAGYRGRFSRRLCRGEEPPPFHWYFDMIKVTVANSGMA